MTPRVHELALQTTRGVVLQVIVVSTDEAPLHDEDIEQAGVLAQMSARAITRAHHIAHCPEHNWEVEFAAVYLQGSLDAMCHCGARRSEVTPA